jgi:voltage-gated potassium channel
MSENSVRRKRRIYDILAGTSSADPAVTRARISLNVLLWAFVVVVIAGSYSSVYAAHQNFFEGVFAFAVAVIALDLVVCLWACTVDPRFSAPIKGRLKCLFTTSLVIDLIIIVPFLAKPFFPGSEALFNSVIALVVLRLVARSRTFGFVLDVLKAKRAELAVALTIDAILLITFSTFMFIVMHPIDPQGFSSIPASAWWAAQTLTTVGYGDLVPTTALGQFVAIIAMFLGIATFAIPIAIIGAGFMEAFDARKGQRHASNDPIQLLRDLANLKEEGVITEEIFEAKQKEILERL